MKELNGKTVVITGAGRGLGAAFALSLADAGCDLILWGRNPADLEAIATLAGQRSSNTPRVVALEMDADDGGLF